MPLFGAPAYDVANERQGDIPFEEQLRGLEQVVKAGKVRVMALALKMCKRPSTQQEYYSSSRQAGLLACLPAKETTLQTTLVAL